VILVPIASDCRPVSLCVRVGWYDLKVAAARPAAGDEAVKRKI